MLICLLVTLLSWQHPTMHRGEAVMGFDQDKTAHHFRLYEDGGAIEVNVKDAADTTDRDAIRSHLPHIATMFGRGDFDAPMLVHDTKDVPGIAVLSARHDRVSYTYSDTPAGGRVDITSADREALAALHDFLRYQIREHATGDSAVVTAKR
jgi:hypothetical protein